MTGRLSDTSWLHIHHPPRGQVDDWGGKGVDPIHAGVTTFDMRLFTRKAMPSLHLSTNNTRRPPAAKPRKSRRLCARRIELETKITKLMIVVRRTVSRKVKKWKYHHTKEYVPISTTMSPVQSRHKCSLRLVVNLMDDKLFDIHRDASHETFST